jgi:hypothetical protein
VAAGHGSHDACAGSPGMAAHSLPSAGRCLGFNAANEGALAVSLTKRRRLNRGRAAARQHRAGAPASGPPARRAHFPSVPGAHHVASVEAIHDEVGVEAKKNPVARIDHCVLGFADDPIARRSSPRAGRDRHMDRRRDVQIAQRSDQRLERANVRLAAGAVEWRVITPRRAARPPRSPMPDATP